MSYTLRLLDVCLSDYFAGHPGLVLAAPVHSRTTYALLREGLHEELQRCDRGDLDWGAAKEAIDAEFAGLSERFLNSSVFSYLDRPREDDGDEVFAYYALVSDEG
jgi:hypothetical protein